MYATARDRSPLKPAQPAGARRCAPAWRDQLVGIDARVPSRDGRLVRQIGLDNAATTPAMRAALDAAVACLQCYGSVHRGAGHNARTSTAAYDAARLALLRFVGADARTHVALFVRNTTEALNRLARRLPARPGDVVVTTAMEHHSNDLPWRRRGPVVRVGVTADGQLDEDDFDRVLARHAGRIALVAVSGASNVTGFVPPVHRLAAKAHAAGAPIAVDAAQLVAHRAIDVRSAGDAEHLDFVAFSGHKMYAPFGAGVLIGPRACFLDGEPDLVGGGTVETVTDDAVEWTGLPDREEAGTPNAVGAIAMAAAAEWLTTWGFDAVGAHESAVADYARARLRTVPGLTLYGDSAGPAADRVGVIPFNLAAVDHALVAAVLGYEAGVSVRNGCFCAQPYVARLLGLAQPAVATPGAVRPGMVRISLGAGSTHDDVDAAVEVLTGIAAGHYVGEYERINAQEYEPRVRRAS